MSKQIAVITGAANGIGAGLSRYAVAQGMTVIACDINKAQLEELQNQTASGPGTLDTQIVDVRKADSLEALAKNVFEKYSQVNFLFNNAGVLVDGKSWTRSEKEWQWSLDVNIMGIVHGIRSFVPRMLEQNQPGRIINTASIGGLFAGTAYLGPYQATKHAVAALTETLYEELKLESADITASVLCPGGVATDIWNSDRLLEPAEKFSYDSDSEKEFHDFGAEMVDQALTPDEFAPKVFQAIEENKFWLFPQPEFKPMFQMRADSILNETNPGD